MPQPPITPLEWAEALAWARAMLAQAPRPLFGPGALEAFHVEPLPPDVPLGAPDPEVAAAQLVVGPRRHLVPGTGQESRVGSGADHAKPGQPDRPR